MEMKSDNILINDITLRDGEQAAGVNFFPEEKLKIAKQLIRLGIPIIEVGFPASSESDFEGVRLVSKEFGNDIIISAMCRSNKKDIDIANDALGDIRFGRIQVVMGTSDIHLKHKFNMSREDAKELAIEMVEYAKSLREDIEFAAEDATRSDLEFLIDICKSCVNVGARTIELPDTVGYATPQEYGYMVYNVNRILNNKKKNGGDIIISTHCHNDLGLATANTLAGIEAGARQIEVTFNGIGERVGNSAAEEIIMILKVRKDIFGNDDKLDYINPKEIMNTSKLVEEFSGIKVAYNKSIVGRNAFLHESGIHQDGVLKFADNYQLIDPKDIGLPGYSFVLGKGSGKHALENKIVSLGFELNKEEMKSFSEYFKKYASKKKFITDDDVINLLKRFLENKKNI